MFESEFGSSMFGGSDSFDDDPDVQRMREEAAARENKKGKRNKRFENGGVTMKVKYGKGGSSDGMYAEAGALITGLAKNKELREMMNAELAKYENGGSVTGGDKGDKGAKGETPGKLMGMEITMVNDKKANEERANQALLDSLQYNNSGNLVNEEGERVYIGSAGVVLSQEDAEALRQAEKAFTMASSKADFAGKMTGFKRYSDITTKKGEKKNDAIWDKRKNAYKTEDDLGQQLYDLYEKLNIPEEQRFITLEKNATDDKYNWSIESTDNMKAASNRWFGGDLQTRRGYNRATR
jgi:hypothetical protein